MKQRDLAEIVGFACAVGGVFCLGLAVSGLVLGLAFGMIVTAAGLILAANV